MLVVAEKKKQEVKWIIIFIATVRSNQVEENRYPAFSGRADHCRADVLPASRNAEFLAGLVVDINMFVPMAFVGRYLFRHDTACWNAACAPTKKHREQQNFGWLQFAVFI
jgi:hypothetical protein